MTFLRRLKSRLVKASGALMAPLAPLLGKPLSPDVLEEMEYALLQADLPVSLVMELMARFGKLKNHTVEEALTLLSAELVLALEPFEGALIPQSTTRPWVVMMVGVNGSGKTTTAGKLAAHWTSEGRSVGLVAADTFRAAASEQLACWAQKAGAEFYHGAQGADSASVVMHALQDAQRKGLECLIIDTAGRLHTKTHLMAELEKMIRVLRKIAPEAPHEALLVLDGTTGQNAVTQGEIFSAAVPLTGLIVTKLDGSAKGGVLLKLTQTLRVPITHLGVGEDLDDLQPFQAVSFVSALMQRPEENT